MSTDFESKHDKFEIRTPAAMRMIKIKTSNSSQCSEITEEEALLTIKAEEDQYEDQEECKTPKSPKNMIPKILNCPPAPKKSRKVASSCKRKLSLEFQFFEAVAGDEVESFFKQYQKKSKTRSLA